MKKTAVILLFIVISLNNFSQNATLLWAKGTSGTSACYPYNFKVDASGNIHTVGYFGGTIDFDPGPGTFTLASLGATDIFILKLDANGNFVWAKSLGGTSNDYGYSIDIDASGNVFTCGSFLGTADFDPSAGTFTLASSGNVDAFISKLDINGNFLWAKKIGSTTPDEANSIKVDASGNILNTGYFSNTVDFDPGPGTFTLNASGTINPYIQKLDGNGNFMWAKSFNSSTSSIGRSIVLDGVGNIYSTGTFDGILDLDPSISSFTVASNGLDDFYISKLDASGNFVWAKSIGGSNTDFVQSIKTDGLGNAFLTGYFKGLCDFDPGASTYTLNSFTSDHAYVLKLDALGNFAWVKNLGGSSSTTWGYDLTIDATNNVYTTGLFTGSSDFDPGMGTFSLTSTGNTDIYITKLNSLGDFLFADKIGNTGGDIGRSIHITTLNILYLSGSFQGTVDFDLGVGTSTLDAVSSVKAYVTKYCVNPTIPSNVTPSTNQLLCASGNSTTLMAVSDGSVSWFSSPISTLSIASGTAYNTPTLSLGSYTYYAESANGCGLSTTRTAITITVSTLPNVSAITSNTNFICVGQSATLTASGASNYTFNPGGVGSSIVVSPSITTNYTVTGMNTSGCQNTAIVTQSVSACTGLENLLSMNQHSAIQVYPNPTNGSFELIINEVSELIITNAIGQVIAKQTLTIGKNSIDLNNYANGIYFLNATSKAKTSYIKLLKQ
ncbi:MAG: SBBP repeat-containing protein [Bacteroidota bacterium]|nr:SBBP repeat-containing protein [Bacteroidota bacterium]